MIMEAVKSHDLTSASCRTRKVCVVWRPDIQEHWWLRAEEYGCHNWSRENSFVRLLSTQAFSRLAEAHRIGGGSLLSLPTQMLVSCGSTLREYSFQKWFISYLDKVRLAHKWSTILSLKHLSIILLMVLLPCLNLDWCIIWLKVWSHSVVSDSLQPHGL